MDARQELLDAARGGDEEAFRFLVEPYGGELQAHCYRMMGSVHDAEDALQDTLLRAWRALGGLESPGSLRAWLYRIATNASLNAIRRRRIREVAGAAVVDSLQPDPTAAAAVAELAAVPETRYEQREAVELAFAAALQHLPARQRAVLVLRDVLGFSAREVAECLATTVASVNSALQRARRTIDERLPEASEQAILRSPADERTRGLAGRFADAFETGDVDAILALSGAPVALAA